jgi:hypothetical protein
MERSDLQRQSARTALTTVASRPAAWRLAVGVLVVLATAAGASAGRPNPTLGARRPTVALLEGAVVDDGALARLVSARHGLLLVDYYDGGDRQRAEHLCGERLQGELSGVRSALRDDRASWRTAQPLECRGLECYYNPGEIGHHDGRYLFRREGGRVVLTGIVRLESGAVGSDAPNRFAAAALRRWRNTRCPRESRP